MVCGNIITRSFLSKVVKIETTHTAHGGEIWSLWLEIQTMDVYLMFQLYHARCDCAKTITPINCHRLVYKCMYERSDTMALLLIITTPPRTIYHVTTTDIVIWYVTFSLHHAHVWLTDSLLGNIAPRQASVHVSIHTDCRERVVRGCC